MGGGEWAHEHPARPQASALREIGIASRPRQARGTRGSPMSWFA